MNSKWYNNLLANEERLLRLRQQTKTLEDRRLVLEAELEKLTTQAEQLEHELAQRVD